MSTRQLLARRGAALLTPGFLLAACAVSTPAARPADFPVHDVQQQFELHWRVSPGPDVTRADGLIERRVRDVADASLHLVGLDASGKIVSFTTPIQVRWASGWDVERFTMTIRPRGGEQRFEVRVQSFQYEEGMRSR